MYSFICVKGMRSLRIIIVSMFVLTLLLGVAANFALASGPSSGYVQYKVNVSGQENSVMPISAPFSTTVNWAVQPSGQSGFVDITIALSSDISNLSYSRVVNASSLPEIFPYLSGLTNQSLSYQIQGFSINANIVNSGQVSTTFNNTSYQATKYVVSFSAVNSSSATSFSGNGTIISMPSGLIESVQLSLNQTASVDIVLLSTDLSLNAQAGSINPLGASLLGVALIAAVAIAGPTIFKKTKDNKNKKQAQNNETKPPQESDAKQEKEDEKKPSYWVD
jgi:hypothetical protein